MASATTNRIKPGAIPYKRFPILYFFSPVLGRELEGLTPYLRSANPSPFSQGSSLPLGRFSFRGMHAQLRLALPPVFVLPTDLNWKKGREGDRPAGFELGVTVQFYAKLYQLLVRYQDEVTADGQGGGGSEPGIGRRTRLLVDGCRWTELLQLMFSEKSEDYHRYATYSDLMNTMVTLAAGVTFLLTQQQPNSSGKGFVGDMLRLSPDVVAQIRDRQDYSPLVAFASRCGLSLGWTIALYCLLYERSGGEAVRTASNRSPEEFLAALDDLVWGGFDPQYKSNPDYELYRRVLGGEKIKPPIGRPKKKKLVTVVPKTEALPPATAVPQEPSAPAAPAPAPAPAAVPAAPVVAAVPTPSPVQPIPSPTPAPGIPSDTAAPPPPNPAPAPERPARRAARDFFEHFEQEETP